MLRALRAMLRALRAMLRALPEHNQVTQWVGPFGGLENCKPTGEGASQNTRGRVCSPKWTESFRLSITGSEIQGWVQNPME